MVDVPIRALTTTGMHPAHADFAEPWHPERPGEQLRFARREENQFSLFERDGDGWKYFGACSADDHETLQSLAELGVIKVDGKVGDWDLITIEWDTQ